MKYIVVLMLLFVMGLEASEYSFRKYEHVRKFYFEITKDAIDICKKYNLPPAAILAMAGLESGYGSGYVSQITGNILSLGAYKSDQQLPRLYLPYSKSEKKVLYDAKIISKYPKSDLSWKKRPPSLKRDYRPSKYAGTTKNLELLKYNDKLKNEARKSCLKDFATRWISENSSVKIYSDTKSWLNSLVDKHGIKILFSKKINAEFIDKIGGKPNSFNYRKSWSKKVKLIMARAGLVKLTKDMDNDAKSFEDAWVNK